MIMVRQGLVELLCTRCHSVIVVGNDHGFVELAELNQAEHEHQLTHLIQEHKDMEVLG